MRRTLKTLSTSLFLLVLMAVPAFAAAEEAAAEVGLFDGLKITAIAGLVVGAILFFDAYATGPHVEDDHGHDHH